MHDRHHGAQNSSRTTLPRCSAIVVGFGAPTPPTRSPAPGRPGGRPASPCSGAEAARPRSANCRARSDRRTVSRSCSANATSSASTSCARPGCSATRYRSASVSPGSTRSRNGTSGGVARALASAASRPTAVVEAAVTPQPGGLDNCFGVSACSHVAAAVMGSSFSTTAKSSVSAAFTGERSIRK